MTRFRKRLYLLILSVVFVITVTIVILLSFGYRLNNDFRLVKTGGIYLYINETGVNVYLDGKMYDRTSLLGREIIMRNLVPKTYSVRVEKEGYRLWRKNIKVLEQQVEVCFPLMVLSKFTPELIPKIIKDKDKKKRVNNKEFTEIIELFNKAGKPSRSIFPGWDDEETAKLKLGKFRKLWKKVFLYKKGSKLYARWTGSRERKPFFLDPADKLPVFSSDKNIIQFGYLQGRNDCVLVLFDDGELIAAELDTRFEIQNIYPVIKDCSEFITKGSNLFYISLSNNAIYMIDFEP